MRMPAWLPVLLCLAIVALATPDLVTEPAPTGTAVLTAGTTAPGDPVTGLRTYWLDVRGIKPDAPGQVRVGVVDPRGTPKADVLFLHGHGDRLDNHRQLFAAWAAAGYRVISFDLPSHGESDVEPIDVWSFDDLFRLIQLVERTTADTRSRPLVLAGWSFGGLLATRLVQAGVHLSRPISALVLLAPAVTPLLFSGGDGITRLSALTHSPDPPVAAPPHPISPLFDPVFAARLLYEAGIADRTTLPARLPTWIAVADDQQDRYVSSTGLLAWARASRSAGDPVTITQCVGARHALDLEPWPVGPQVIASSTAFITATLTATPFRPSGAGPCQPR